MATVNPSMGGAVNIAAITWAGMVTGDTITRVEPSGLLPLFGSVQFTGTFGGATLGVQGSNDGTNWVALKDKSNATIALTSAGAAEFSTAMRYLRPSISGGTSNSVTATLVMRGQ